MKIRSATSSEKSPFKWGWLTAVAFMPLLSACSSDSFSGLWFSSDQEQTSVSANTSASSSSMEGTKLSSAACGLFLGAADQSPAKNNTASPTEISLNSSPQENLLQAIGFDIDGDYGNARKLYVWLTASPPDIKVDLDCGNGIRLSGSVNSLAQRRLVALDTDAPEYARSTEIESVVASATVAPGPELPNPPHVERNTSFYETGGVIIAAPEDSTTPATRMNMDFSENTSQLTRVERRAPQSAAVAVPVMSAAETSTPASMAAPKAKAVPVIVAKPSEASSPVPKTSTNSMTATQPTTTITPPAIEPATISGASETTENTGAVVTSNSRPVEQGQLDIVDREPASSMIELPMMSNPQQPKPTTQAANKTPMAAPKVVPVAKTTSSVYYAVQLAAYRSRERAEGAWPKFQSTSRGVLASAPHEVISISIEGQGLFFRLLTGQYKTKADASQACGELKSVGVDCLIRQITP